MKWLSVRQIRLGGLPFGMVVSLAAILMSGAPARRALAGEGTGVRGGGVIDVFEIHSLMEEIATDIEEKRLQIPVDQRLTPEAIRALVSQVKITEVPRIVDAVGERRMSAGFAREFVPAKRAELRLDADLWLRYPDRPQHKAAVYYALEDIQAGRTFASDEFARKWFKASFAEGWRRLRVLIAKDPTLLRELGAIREDFNPELIRRVTRLLALPDQWRLGFSTTDAPLPFTEADGEKTFKDAIATSRTPLLALSTVNPDAEILAAMDRGIKMSFADTLIGDVKFNRIAWWANPSPNIAYGFALHEVLQAYGLNDVGYPLSRAIVARFDREFAEDRTRSEIDAFEIAGVPIVDLSHDAIAKAFDSDFVRPESLLFDADELAGQWRAVLDLPTGAARAEYRAGGLGARQLGWLPSSPHLEIELGDALNETAGFVGARVRLLDARMQPSGAQAPLAVDAGMAFAFAISDAGGTGNGELHFECRISRTGRKFLLCRVSRRDAAGRVSAIGYRGYAAMKVALNSAGTGTLPLLAPCQIYRANWQVNGRAQTRYTVWAGSKIIARSLASIDDAIALVRQAEGANPPWCRDWILCDNGVVSEPNRCN